MRPLFRLGCSFLLLAGSCTPTSRSPLPDILVGSSREKGDLYRWSLRRERLVRVWKIGEPIRDIRDTSLDGEVLLAAGKEVRRIHADRDAIAGIATFENDVDAVGVLPDGTVLALEHPPGSSGERQGPHRLHRLSPTGDSGVTREPWAVNAMAYDLSLDGDLAVVTWLAGRDVEWCDLSTPEPFQRLSLRTGVAGERVNLRAVVRHIAFEPGEGMGWLLENAILVGDRVEPEALALWRCDFAGNHARRYDLESRGAYQGGLVRLGAGRLLANGFDRILLITVREGRVAERVFALDGHYRGMAKDPGSERVVLVGSDRAPPDPGAGRIVVVDTDPFAVRRWVHFPLALDAVCILRRRAR